jgi:hypothetical protein
MSTEKERLEVWMSTEKERLEQLRQKGFVNVDKWAWGVAFGTDSEQQQQRCWVCFATIQRPLSCCESGNKERGNPSRTQPHSALSVLSV